MQIGIIVPFFFLCVHCFISLSNTSSFFFFFCWILILFFVAFWMQLFYYKTRNTLIYINFVTFFTFIFFFKIVYFFISFHIRITFVLDLIFYFPHFIVDCKSNTFDIVNDDTRYNLTILWNSIINFYHKTKTNKNKRLRQKQNMNAKADKCPQNLSTLWINEQCWQASKHSCR